MDFLPECRFDFSELSENAVRAQKPDTDDRETNVGIMAVAHIMHENMTWIERNILCIGDAVRPDPELTGRYNFQDWQKNCGMTGWFRLQLRGESLPALDFNVIG